MGISRWLRVLGAVCRSASPPEVDETAASWMGDGGVRALFALYRRLVGACPHFDVPWEDDRSLDAPTYARALLAPMAHGRAALAPGGFGKTLPAVSGSASDWSLPLVGGLSLDAASTLASVDGCGLCCQCALLRRLPALHLSRKARPLKPCKKRAFCEDFVMCRAADVLVSGYYAWRKRPLCTRKREDGELTQQIVQAFRAHRGVYGSPRIVAELRAQGTCVGAAA